jgi:hypothetical protein
VTVIRKRFRSTTASPSTCQCPASSCGKGERPRSGAVHILSSGRLLSKT